MAKKTIKLTENQLKEVKEQISEGWQFNPNKYVFLGTVLKDFIKKIGREITVPELHGALQKCFNFQPHNLNGHTGYYDKAQIEYAYLQGIGMLRKYFGVSIPEQPQSIPVGRQTYSHDKPEDNEFDRPKSEMELASDELLRNQEVYFDNVFENISEENKKKTIYSILDKNNVLQL